MIPENDIWQFDRFRIACDRPVVMGILNVTPDSFSDGGRFIEKDKAVRHALRLAEEGADIIDIGGESTRPGSDEVDEDEELRRVIPVIEAVGPVLKVPVSVDTRRLSVAERAFEAGASIINDVSGLRDDPEIADFAAEKGLGLVIMHMLGRPRTMQDNPVYENVVQEIGSFFRERMDFAAGRGVKPGQTVLDPGIGFGKTLEHNLTILRECGSWLNLRRPIMVGPSRKRFIGAILKAELDERLAGTVGACVAAYFAGARIFRVHDVKPVKDALRVAHAIAAGSTGEQQDD